MKCDGDAHVSGDDHNSVGASVHARSATDHCRRRNGSLIDWKTHWRGELRDGKCSAARTNVVFTNSYVDNNSSLISEQLASFIFTR
jgi:hypothetical protein